MLLNSVSGPEIGLPDPISQPEAVLCTIDWYMGARVSGRGCALDVGIRSVKPGLGYCRDWGMLGAQVNLGTG